MTPKRPVTALVFASLCLASCHQGNEPVSKGTPATGAPASAAGPVGGSGTSASPEVALAGVAAPTTGGVDSVSSSDATELFRRGKSTKTDAAIAQLQQKVRAKPDDARALASLADAYLQKIRETSDPGYYALADAALRKAITIAPNDLAVISSQTSLLLGRHDFEDALVWAKRAKTVNPNSAGVYALLGDAQVELGKYQEATENYQKAVDMRPGMATYSRVSYVDELNGNLDAAIDVMKLAADSGSVSENTAWCRVQLANLLVKQGRFAEAERQLKHALFDFPEFIHAQAAMAALKMSEGKSDEAIKLYEGVTNRVPVPAYLILLGDLYAKTGRQADAQRTYQLIAAIDKLYQSNGVGTDLEMALFEADHGTNLPNALERAQREYTRHATVRAADALSWTLFKSGKVAEASAYSRKALHLGTKEPMYFYHAAMISLAAGRKSDARRYLASAVAKNPNFSALYSADAHAALKKLQAEV